MSKHSILDVLVESRSSLERAFRNIPGSCDFRGLTNTLEISEKDMNSITGCIPAHATLLSSAISNICDKKFPTLKTALEAAKGQLHWRIDDGGFYAEGANVGDGYKDGNMHALLVGPKECPIVADDFLLGFFLLAPNTLYRDHKHLAPEVYLPLTGPSGWRFDQGDWEDHDAGRIIFNAPDAVHATRVYDVPFLALFAWSRDVDSVCSVVTSEDWEEIEAELAKSANWQDTVS